MTSHRIDGYGLIDRGQPLNFTFDGKSYRGFQGDTLASALLANGVRVMGRSFKYHRPRGVWSAWVDDPNAIMTVTLNGREMPNCLATTTLLEDGMQARAVNAWPSAQMDIKGGLDLFHRWLSAGFYYKTFMWPDWHLFEPMIRRMAGLGSVARAEYDDYVSDQLHDRCDTLVVGGGASGLAAARAAVEKGEDVLLIDDHPQLGGTLYQHTSVEGQSPSDWIAEMHSAFVTAGGRALTNTTAFGVFDHNLVGLAENGAFGSAPRLRRLRAGRIILATGALDRPMTFPDNDRPGVMSLLAAAEYLSRYGVLMGQDAVTLSNNTQGHTAAAVLEAAGMNLNKLSAQTTPLRVIGGKRLRGLKVGEKTYAADTVLVSGGLTPLVHLWRHANGKLDWCETRQAFLPGRTPAGMQAIGAANGTFDLAPALEEARAIGAAKPYQRPALGSYKLTPHWPKPGSNGRQWIDFQHDVTLKDVELAARENFVSVEHLKRYTTLGMASDQGKSSNMAGLAAMAAIQGRPIPEVGTTTFRPPFVPLPIETYHGHIRNQNRHPLKRLPLETEHRALGAALGEYGGWLRPGWYGAGAPDPIVQREALQARQTAGFFDGSPLGKIEVIGPDAEAFVNFIYYNTISTLKPGMIRYGFMLTEGGIVMDDGVISRLAPDRFVISCSSSHVDSVRTHLEVWRQDGNNPDRIFVHDMTQQWATVTVTGPKARAIVKALDPGIDVSAAAFPHMALRDAHFRGQALRIARVSFTGDASFELSIAASYASDLWNAVVDAGQAVEAVPIGIEALSILRAEKGYLMVGKDTDGETMPHDLGFGVPRQKKKVAFVGDRSLHSAKANAPERKSLIGLKVPEGEPMLPTGAHVVSEGATRRSEGYVTSSYQSPFLARPIALGLVARGADRLGETVTVWHKGQMRKAQICASCAFDPDGERLNA